MDALATGIDLLTACNDGWQRAQVQREFADVLARAGCAQRRCCGCPTIPGALDAQLAGRPTRPAAGMTVCTMRSRYARCRTGRCAIVGLDDGVFFRS